MNTRFLDKKFLVSNAVAATSLILLATFPLQGFFQGTLAVFVFLFLLPFLFIKLILKEEAASYGFSWGNFRVNTLWILGMLLLLGLIILALSSLTSIIPRFGLPQSTQSSFVLFLVYIGILGIYLALYQFFFGGFLLFLWKRKVNAWAILVQAMALVAFLSLKGGGLGVSEGLVVYMLPTLFSGLIAYKTKSIFPAFIFWYLSAILGIVAIIVSSR